jgi:hypothetical protein
MEPYQGSKPFSNTEYLALLRALHPDSTDAERRHDAFALIKERESVLRGTDALPQSQSWAPTPWTVEERAAIRRKRAARSNAAKASWQKRRAAA